MLRIIKQQILLHTPWSFFDRIELIDGIGWSSVFFENKSLCQGLCIGLIATNEYEVPKDGVAEY